MRCSLLTLSTYLDDELPQDRRAEVDAHLVGCQRCRNGVGYLEEEVSRVSSLARVHVPDHSARQLMEQMGLIGPDEVLPTRGMANARPHEKAPPWLLAGAGGAALPWLPRRQSEEDTVDHQQALPFADVPLDQLDSAVLPSARTRDDAEVELNGRAAEAAGVESVAEIPAPPDAAPDVAEAQPPVAEVPVSDVPVIETPAPLLPPPAEPPVAEAPIDEPMPSALSRASSAPVEPVVFEAIDLDRIGAAWPMTREPGIPSLPDLSPAPNVPRFEFREPTRDPKPAAEVEATSPAIPEASIPPMTTTPSAVSIPAVEPAREEAPSPVASTSPGSDTSRPRWHGLDNLDDDAWGWAPRETAEVPTLRAEVPDAVAPTPVAEPEAWHSHHIDETTPSEPTAEESDNVGPVLDRLSGPPKAVRPSLISRIRDQVALRLALAHPRREDDSVQIVSGLGAPPRVGSPRRSSRRGDAAAPRAAASHPAHEPSQQFPSIGGVLADSEPPVITGEPMFDDEPPAVVMPSMAALTAPEPIVDTAPVAAPALPRPAPGRHSRALSARRAGTAATDAGARVRDLVAAAAGRGREVIQHPRQRWIAAGAAIAVVLVLFLGLRHTTNAPSPTANSHPGTAAPIVAVAPPVAAQPVAPSVAPTAAPAPAAIVAGSGGTGWQVAKVRYGIHPNDFRIVYDMAPAGTATGSPTVKVSFPTPTTMLVDFATTQPSGSPGTIPPGGVVTGVSLLSNHPGHAVYQYTLSQAVTADVVYITGPLRLVVDLH